MLKLNPLVNEKDIAKFKSNLLHISHHLEKSDESQGASAEFKVIIFIYIYIYII